MATTYRLCPRTHSLEALTTGPEGSHRTRVTPSWPTAGEAIEQQRLLLMAQIQAATANLARFNARYPYHQHLILEHEIP